MDNKKADCQDSFGLAGVIDEVIQSKAWKVYYPRHILWKKWAEIVGEKIAENSFPWYFKGLDCLVIGVSQNIWLHHLNYAQNVILEKINSYLPESSKIKKLQFRIGNIDEIRASINTSSFRKSVEYMRARARDNQKHSIGFDTRKDITTVLKTFFRDIEQRFK